MISPMPTVVRPAMKAFLTAVTLTLLLAACAGQPQTPLTLEQRLAALALQQGPEVHSISRFMISDWQYLDERHIIISTSPRSHYLISFAFVCTELNFASAIHFTTTGESLTVMDKIYTRDTRPLDCPIRSIHRLEPLTTAPADDDAQPSAPAQP